MMVSVLNRSIITSLRSSSISTCIRSISSAQHHRPLMLMDLPRIAYPNLLVIIKNFFSRLTLNTYFDRTFAIKPFTDGARQAVTVVSRLIANEQFDDLPGFVTTEVINEVKENFQHLTSQQKQQIPVEEREIVFSYPYLIDLITDEQTNTRLVEISMIFHVLKNPESYQEEMLQSNENTLTTWTSTIRKMRDNMIVCNYRFLRDISKNVEDESWIITGLNHWVPNEYFQQQ